MGKLRGLLANLVLFAATTAFIIIALEVFFRFYIGGQTHTVGGPAFGLNDEEMNEYYLRDTDLPDKEAFRILAVGDSFTYGHGIKNPEKAWPQQLEHLFAEGGNGTVSVVNAGLPGLNTPDELVLFDTVGREFHPQVVILGYSINDAVSDEQYDNSGFVYNTFVRKITAPGAGGRYAAAKEKYAPGLKEFEIRGLKNKVADFLFTKSYLWFFLVTRYDAAFRKVTFAERYEDELFGKFSTGHLSRHLSDLKTLMENIRSTGAEPVIVIIPYPVRLDHYPFTSANDLIREFGTENKVTVVDPLPAFAGKDGKQLQVNPYDLHLNEEGNRLVACYVYKQMVKSANVSSCSDVTLS